MRSDNDYADVEGAMGLVAVEWNLAGATSPDWMNGGTCSDQRIDSECLYGNNCERIFTDYSGGPGCYPATDTGRCFNDGVTCGHHLIEDFELWVKAENPLGSGSASCSSIGQAGVFMIQPMSTEPFKARCDGDGFMKVLQIHDEPYLPTSTAFGVTKDATVDGLVLSLSFDDGTLADSSLEGQTVTANGNPTFVDGKVGAGALQFDGLTQLTVADTKSLNIEDEMSHSCWVKLEAQAYNTGAAQEMNIAEKGEWTGNWLSHIKVGASSNLAAGAYYFAFAASSFAPVNVADNVREIHPGTWTHVAFTWDGTTRKLYVNGVLDGEDVPTGKLGKNSDPLEIGGRLAGNTFMFRGLMDEFKLFNRALDADEVGKLASTGLGVDGILQCNGGKGMLTMTSSHCDEKTIFVDRGGRALDCRMAPSPRFQRP
jgi:hypothetical protein